MTLPKNKKTLRSIFLMLSIALLSLINGCQSAPFNETAYPYAIQSEAINKRSINNIVIAHQNLGPPSKKYLRPYQLNIDKAVKQHLELAGYNVIDNQELQAAWREATRKYGHPYDKQSSQLNSMALKRVLSSTFAALREQGNVDAIIFTDLIEQTVAFSHGSNRMAKWDGVSRKLRIKGIASIAENFDWAQTVPAVSLRTVIYSIDGTALFKSAGGLEVSRQLDSRKSSGRFVRREKLFTRKANIEEGVNLAFYPFIVPKKFPAPQQ